MNCASKVTEYNDGTIFMSEPGEIPHHSTGSREGTNGRNYYLHVTVVHSTTTHHTVLALQKVHWCQVKKENNPNEGLHAYYTR